MVTRCSFSIDPELVEAIDLYAKKQSVERNEAILTLIEAGLASSNNGGSAAPRQRRSFEEIHTIRKEIDGIKSVLTELHGQMRLLHHTIEADWKSDAQGVPFQTPPRTLWEFWKK